MTSGSEKLPLWRLMSGIGVLGSLAAMLLSLLPIYVRNHELAGYVRTVASGENAPDTEMTAGIVKKARELNLPVQPADVHVEHRDGRARIRLRYIVETPFRVDLHLRAGNE